MKFFTDMCILMTTSIRKVSNIRYASIRELDISNGEGVGVALFVQGCRFKCHNCFNSETWDFNGGKEWTPEIEDKFIELANRPYVKRLSILGGEPLADENLEGVLHLIDRFYLLFPNKYIWLYTGYKWENLHDGLYLDENWEQNVYRREIVSKCNIVVDGMYIDSLRDISLKWRGSSNQRVIDVKKSLNSKQIVLYTD